ncbi:hypothetical protein PEC18_30935, partial [Paucibacter sp. O1-1]|nr:hypothetical protein [Paucibacter sp. O1-1]MDA3830123.1 hypothetical protein [Paucibacter sp. O1-1]
MDHDRQEIKNHVMLYRAERKFVSTNPKQWSRVAHQTGTEENCVHCFTDSHGKGEHEHNGGSTLLAKALNDNVPGVNAIVIHNEWPKDSTVLSDADAIVLYMDGGGDHMALKHTEELDRLMKKGIGLVNLHFALEVLTGRKRKSLELIGGYFEINWSVNPVWEANF